MSCESEKLFQLGGLLGARGLQNPGLLKQYGHSHNSRCNHETHILKPKYEASPEGFGMKSNYDAALNAKADYFTQPVKLYSAPSSAIKYLAPAAKISLSQVEPQRKSKNIESTVTEEEFEARLESRIKAARMESARMEEQQWMQ